MSEQLSPKKPFHVYLIGDTGDISHTGKDPVMEMLKSHINSSENSMVVFLGDNVYPRGLPPEGHLLRKGAETVLKRHHEVLNDYHGKVVFIGGNHDWNKGRKDGYEYVLRQEKYLENLFEGKNVFLPSNGCPGPTEVNVSEHFTLVIINTQWWMQSGFRPIGKHWGCRVETEEQFFDHLEAILEENKHKFLLVAGHHPVYSYSIHGGRFRLKDHIFPLTIYDKNAYIPLPFIGSLLPLYRKWLGAREDMSNPRYRRLRKRLKAIFANYPNLIYAAGHEHNLQYIFKNENHFIVSGAGSKTKYVIQNGKHLQFGIKAKGFFKLEFNIDGSVINSSWVIDADKKKAEGNLVFQQKII